MIDAPGSGAASVASQLLAFSREPARFRPHYIHGDEKLPEGHVVLKFALGRFSHGWHRDLSEHDQQELSEAARAFVRQVCLWERATPYQVLCLGRDAGRDAIKENYRLLMALLHPDRQDAMAHAWPADSAQRVNDAYAILSGDGSRSAYDEGVWRFRPAAPFEHVVAPSIARAGAGPRRTGWARSFVVVSAVVAALFVVQSWWVSDEPEQYALLERAFPLRASAKWVRDALPNAKLPRFMDFQPVAAFDPIEFLAPSKQPRRLASVSVWTPSPVSSDATAQEPGRPTVVPATLPAPAGVAPQNPPREIAPPTLRLAQAVVPPPAAPPSPPRGGAVAAPTPTPTPEHVEMLVARLVSYYEAGDSQGLVGLFDPDEIGFWKGFRTRTTYSDFFRATRERRLRMDRLKWQTISQVAQARGDATVIADYSDGTGKVERKVPVEIDIALRGGQARITRLLLFPGGN